MPENRKGAMRKEDMMEGDEPTFFMMPGYSHEESEWRGHGRKEGGERG